MTRSAASRKNQSNRQENGLVGPGKKVTKQKSSGHLNGNSGNGSATGPGASAHFDLSAVRSTSDTAVTSPTVSGKGGDSTKADGNVRGMLNGHSKGGEMAAAQENGEVMPLATEPRNDPDPMPRLTRSSSHPPFSNRAPCTTPSPS